MKKPWYRMQVKEDDSSVADIYVFDLIGDWIDQWINEVFDEESTVTAKGFVKQLAQLPESVKTIRVHVNSPGGDVFAAVTIANALRDQRTAKGRKVEMSVEGLAASAASVIIQAGDPIRIADNALIMVHNPWTRSVGESKDLRKDAEALDTVRDTLIATYRWHSDLGEKEIAALMDETTWMDADDAIAKGFATEKVEGLQAAASLDPRAIAMLSVPEKYRERVKAMLKPEPEPAPTPAKPDPKAIVHACKAAGLPELAAELLEEPTLDAVNAKLEKAKADRAAADTRAAAIRGLCKNAKVEDRADHYISAGVSVDFVKSEIAWVTAKMDKVEIDSHLDPDADTRRATGGINVIEVYRELNQLPAGKGA